MLRIPTCDILVILDCSFSAKFFAREVMGKKNVELLVSAAEDARSPAPFLPQSFTSTLYEALKRLLHEKPQGFDTSCLYREVYHTMPVTQPPRLPNTKPLHFDLACGGLGKILLCPQVPDIPKLGNQGSAYIQLKVRLNKQPDLSVMNELALSLRYLPHVDQIAFEDLYAPRQQVSDFMRTIILAQRIRPLIRKMQARRRLRDLANQRTEDRSTETPSSLLRLHLEQHHSPVYDWGLTTRVDDHKLESSDRPTKENSLSSAPTTGTVASTNKGHSRSDRKRRRSASAELEHGTSNKAQRLEKSGIA